MSPTDLERQSSAQEIRHIPSPVRLVGRDLPEIAPHILDHSAPVPIWQVERLFKRCRARLERAAIGRVDVVDVHIEKRWHRLAKARVADQDERIADFNLRWAITLDVTNGVERASEELDQIGSPLNNDARCNRMPARGNTRDHGCSSKQGKMLQSDYLLGLDLAQMPQPISSSVSLLASHYLPFVRQCHEGTPRKCDPNER